MEMLISMEKDILQCPLSSDKSDDFGSCIGDDEKDDDDDDDDDDIEKDEKTTFPFLTITCFCLAGLLN